MTDDVIRFPGNAWRRAANRRGKRSLSCIVSDRWLQFEAKAQPTTDGTAVFMNVITSISGKDRKIARLCVTLEDLRRVLKTYE